MKRGAINHFTFDGQRVDVVQPIVDSARVKKKAG